MLGWSCNPKEVRALSWELAEIYGEQLLQQTTPAAKGLKQWLESASAYNMPCAVASALDRATAKRVLERLCLVSASLQG